MSQLFYLYHELNQVFLGVTLESIKKKQQNNPNISLSKLGDWLPIFSKEFYYQLNRSDLQFNAKFRSNLELSKKNQDKDYYEYLKALIQEINPKLLEDSSLDLWAPDFDAESFNLKPKPKILMKPKPKKVKKNPYKTKAEPDKYLLSDGLKRFLKKQDLDAPDEISIGEMKTIMNRYVSQRNLQNLSHRTHILLNKELETLFAKELKEANNPSEISYQDLKSFLRKHLVAENQ